MKSRHSTKLLSIISGIILMSISFLISCKKSINGDNKSLYPAPPKLPVEFLGSEPSPASAISGDVVTFDIKGLDSIPAYTFYINQIKADILKVTDSLIMVTVPENASTGPASVVTTDGQYYYGPVLKILGKVSTDPTFKVTSGTNGEITSVVSTTATTGPQQKFILGGSFTDYNAQSTVTSPINNIVMISGTGVYQDPNATSASAPGEGLTGGRISSILQIAGNKYLIGGTFSKYNDISGLSNITRLNSDISIDSTVVDLVNPDPDHYPQNSKDTVSAFNAGFTYGRGGVVKMFNDNSTGNYIVLGNFGQYYNYYYPRSEKGTLIQMPIVMNNIARLKTDATLDSTYNFNKAASQSYEGTNGAIVDAVQLSNGEIIIAGSFTTLNGAAAPGITALTNDGTQDQNFTSAIGTGADGSVTRITYNSTLHKLLVTGNFKHFNGKAAAGIVMLNEDGSQDNTLQLKQFGDGTPNFAGQLNNGQIIVSGTFSTYDGIVRQGFVILNSDGSIAKGYNNTGAFNGAINGMLEDVNGSGQRTVLLYGSFSLFDDSKAGNIIRIILD